MSLLTEKGRPLRETVPSLIRKVDARLNFLCGEQTVRLIQCNVDVAADVFLSEQIVKVGLFQRFVDLLVYTGKNDADPLALRGLAQDRQVMYAGRVDERNLAHADDPDLRTVVQHNHLLLEFIGNAEKVGAVDFVDLNAVGDGQMFGIQGDIHIGIRIDLVGQNRNVGRFCNPFHKQQTGNDQTDLYGNGQIEQNGQQKSD